MLKLTRTSVNYKKYGAILLAALVVLVGLSSQHAWSGNGLPRIDGKTLAILAKQHPVVVLFRHAERCDRSDNPCLSDKTGITVNGAQRARALGKAFSADIKNYDLWSSSTVRTIQSATWFSAGQKLAVDKNMRECGRGVYRSINALIKKSRGNNVVVFTHNHCLSYIAKDKRGVKYEPDYLDGLVMHAEKGTLFLDGEFVAK